MYNKPYDIKHWQNTLAYMRLTARQFDDMAARVSRIYATIPTDVPFNLNSYPGIKKAIELELQRLAYETRGGIINGINNEWQLSNAKADRLVDTMLRGRALPAILEKKWMGRNMDALQAFEARTVRGVNLSSRVWNLVKDQSVLIEQHMALGIYEGTPATQLASEMKKYLRDPDALFRRVRDESDNLQLSKPARAYEAGKGRYRSAYKNALRLTRTETNLAYQSADNLRWGQMDFVLGVRVQRSNVDYDCDICSAGVGDYPKGYDWTLWHPNCRCVATPILATQEDFLKSVNAGMDGKEYQFNGYVQDIPESMTNLKATTGFEHYGHTH